MTTKKEVAAFVKNYGCTAHYSGKTRTMHIRKNDRQFHGTASMVELKVIKRYPNLPFGTNSEPQNMITYE